MPKSRRVRWAFSAPDSSSPASSSSDLHKFKRVRRLRIVGLCLKILRARYPWYNLRYIELVVLERGTAAGVVLLWDPVPRQPLSISHWMTWIWILHSLHARSISWSTNECAGGSLRAVEGVFLTDSVLTEARPDTSVSDQTFSEQWQFHPTCEWSGSRAWGWLFAEGGFQGTITWSGCWISSLVIDMSPSSQVALGNYALSVQTFF